MKFEAVKIDSLFVVLYAVAWLDSPGTRAIARYANVDPRTVGKILKNARLIGLVQSPDDNTYVLAKPYPYQGTLDAKRNVVREALLKYPLLRSIRQFLGLGDGLEDAMRKAATVAGEKNYDKSAIAPLVSWANSEKASFADSRLPNLEQLCFTLDQACALCSADIFRLSNDNHDRDHNVF